MVRKEKLVIAVAWLLVMASIIMSANATVGVRLQLIERVVQPQAGCRCCWFIWKPLIRCGKVCCEDGCCT
ncbi:hypothetical protein I3843_09G108800 [Carya illinoinensis]|uniref:Transmembrane protein n=1 Tax=Carya illinoinensis TaxID=32201 RepID=A0A8T1PBE8_CARIL|nr:hypothetical protein I3760_09G108500 [Carya illinoinensis]KAG6641976.1 hypothetical protein CIPAW_09G111100 [Carya illinoinensis]KAG6695653.1 hypothetical protein I3842_09G108700 [Carya illinoinensis]KAG7963239.1 hypothetical protein I3843_09G108800 [Carya illinoinensis]